MTYEDLLDRIISDGIAEVREAYADPADRHKRDGAIDGFETCRGKSPAQLVKLHREAEDEAIRIKHWNVDKLAFMQLTYWHQRYKALQIEFVMNVVSVGLVNGGQPPLLEHLPTASAAMKYATIVGVRGGAEMRS